MSMVMFVIGCVAIMVGVVMVGFGIPVNEFSFGNTLITSGTMLATGGLLVISLSTVVTQLHRIADGLASRAPVLPAHPAQALEGLEAPAAEPRPAQARIPFPPKQAAMQPAMQPGTREPRPADLPVAADLDADDQHPGQSFAPALRNPEAPPPVTVDDEVSLSPQATNGSAGEPRHEPAFGTDWRAPPAPPRETPSYFDSMWPAKPRTTPAAEPAPDMPRERETITRAPAQARAQANEPPRAAVLKSGVVDGMGYTLYVDGSIEAELPQGTLRFASIDELRSHLEKNG